MGEQIITLNGVQYAILPLKVFEQLREIAEDYQDAAAANKVMEKIKSGEMELFPASIIEAIELEDKNPVKVYREYRKMTQEELAEKSGVSVHMVRKIEAGESKGSVDTIKAIAEALRLNMELLV